MRFEINTGAGASIALSVLLPMLMLPAQVSAETILGVYIFHRHGDRTSKSTPPTRLTTLGAEQVYRSGQYYRSLYVAGNATGRVAGLSADVAVASQINVVSPVDNVLQNSAQAFLQGLYPPTAGDVETLADGSAPEAPLGGYQYVPVNSLTTAATPSGAEGQAWLQAASGCNKAVASSRSYYDSREFLDTLESTRGFYNGLLPAINRTFSADQANFKNGYTIFDLINVAQIHNASYGGRDLVSDAVMHQLATRADQHEWGLAFNASEPARAVAGATLAGQALQALNATLRGRSSSSSAPRVAVQFGAYGTFASFFGLARLHELSADFTGVAGYASSMALELVGNYSGAAAAGDVGVRFRFANGSAADAAPGVFPLFGRAEAVLPWSVFADEMARIAVVGTAQWCSLCGNTDGACAADQTTATSAGTAAAGGSGGAGVSSPVAGVIGAVVALAAVLAVGGLAMMVMGLRVVRKRNLPVPMAGSDKASV